MAKDLFTFSKAHGKSFVYLPICIHIFWRKEVIFFAHFFFKFFLKNIQLVVKKEVKWSRKNSNQDELDQDG
jgi:hypothetical protein